MDNAEAERSSDSSQQVQVTLEDWSQYSAQATDQKASGKDLPPVEFFDSKQLSEPDDFQKFMESQKAQKDKPPAIKDRYDQSSIKDAIDASIKNGVPMVVHTGAEWCGPCVKMEKTVWPNVEKDLKGKAVFTHLDVDKVNDPNGKVATEAKKLIDGIEQVPNIRVMMPERQKDGSIKFKTLEENKGPMNEFEVRAMLKDWIKKPERK